MIRSVVGDYSERTECGDSETACNSEAYLLCYVCFTSLITCLLFRDFALFGEQNYDGPGPIF